MILKKKKLKNFNYKLIYLIIFISQNNLKYSRKIDN